MPVYVSTKSWPRRQPQGAAIIYVVVAMTALTALAAMAVDLAHARLVKSQLQTAADAAARAGAAVLSNGYAAAQTAAVAAASANTADGASVALVTASDIDFGTWANNTYTSLPSAQWSSANAIKVTCRRTGARGTAVLTYFGSLVGATSTDVTVTATASGTPRPQAGFIGYSGITFKNNNFIGGYNSSVTTSPTTSTADKNVRVGTNATISGGTNDTVYGDLVLGPSASASGVTVAGTTYHQSSSITVPSLPAWSPQANPGGIAQAYTVSSATTLPGGSYWFTSLTLNANLSFSGPAVLYVNGDIFVGATLQASSGHTADLKIYQYGSHTFGDIASNGMNITANVIAPSSAFTVNNNLNFMGSGIFNTIDTKNNANFFYDEAQGPMNGANVVITVK